MDITEYEEFYKWYRINEQRFHCAQMTEVQIAYSAYLHGIKQAGINTVLCTVASEGEEQNGCGGHLFQRTNEGVICIYCGVHRSDV
jgi:hypothetical protein